MKLEIRAEADGSRLSGLGPGYSYSLSEGGCEGDEGITAVVVAVEVDQLTGFVVPRIRMDVEINGTC